MIFLLLFCFVSANNLEAEPLPIPMSTDLKMVEFELDGKIANLSVYDSIEIISKVNLVS